MLVIGVGGSGRGVLNYLKKSFEDEYGSPEAAGVFLLGIDGPIADQYVINDYQIDTQPNSKEFYKYRIDPQAQINNRKTGGAVPFIDTWFSQEAALRTPNVHTNPGEGFGGVRTIGRCCFYLEVQDLKKKIQDRINEAHTFHENQNKKSIHIFIVGSFSGGAGSGTLLDIARLTRQISNDGDYLNCVISLPSNFGKLANEEPAIKIQFSAKNFAALREAMRDLVANSEMPVQIEYAQGISVSKPTIFKDCFLIDTSSLGANEPPLYTFCPAAADFIYQVRMDYMGIKSQMITTEWPNFIQNVVFQAPTVQEMFSSFGIHTYMVSTADLLEYSKLRFARDIYDRMLNIPDDKSDEPEKNVRNFLQSMPFTAMALVANDGGKALPTAPQDYMNLIARIKSGNQYQSETADMLNSPIPDLMAPVKREDKFFGMFGGASNTRAMQLIEDERINCIGQPSDGTGSMTVYGTLRERADIISKFFVLRIIDELKRIFYKLENDELIPKPLSEMPYTLALGRAMLDKIEAYTANLSKYMNDSFKQQSRTTYLGHSTDIQTQKQAEMEEIGKKLTAAYHRDIALQQAYAARAGHLLQIQIWKAAMTVAKETADRLLAYAKSLNAFFGQKMKGWEWGLGESRDEVAGESQKLMYRRKEFAKAVTRTYVPAIGGPGENGIYNDFVFGHRNENDSLISILLNDMTWKFYADQEINLQHIERGLGEKADLDFDPGVYIDSFVLLLGMPQVENYNPEQHKVKLHELFTGDSHHINISDHSYHALTQFAENHLKAPFENMTIWDAFVYGKRDPETPSENDVYAKQVHNRLLSKSHVLAMPEDAISHTNIYEVASVINAPDPNQPSTNIGYEICSLFTDPANNGELKKRISRIELAGRFNYGNWSKYDETQKDYLDYTSPYFGSDANVVEVHLDTEELNARKLEHYMILSRLVKDNVTLDPTVVRFMRDPIAFLNFGLVYAMDLLPSMVPQGAGGIAMPQYYVGDTANPQWLGETWDMGCVLSLYSKAGIDAVNIRTAIRNIWSDYEQKQEEDYPADWRNRIAVTLEKKVEFLNLKPIPIGKAVNIRVNREHLALAIRASVKFYAENLKSAHTAVNATPLPGAFNPVIPAPENPAIEP